MQRCFIILLVLLSIKLHADESWVSESHTLGASPKPVDILFVFDISADMQESQLKLSEALPSFIEELNAPYHLGITNSDMTGDGGSRQGHLYKLTNTGQTYITPTDRDGPQLLQATIPHIGTTQDEEPLRATVQNIINYAKSDFYQKNSDLYTIYLSNEDELSTGPNWATKPGHVLKAVEVAFSNKHLYSFGFLIPPGDGDCLKAQGEQATFGEHINYLNEITNGESFSICQSSYSNSMSKVAQRINDLSYFITLDELPDTESIDITFSNEYHPEWHIEKNKIYFHSAPGGDTQIKVKYLKSKNIIQPK